jgi:hypothetical protein
MTKKKEPLTLNEVVMTIDSSIKESETRLERNLKQHISVSIEDAVDELARAVAKGFDENDRMHAELNARFDRLESRYSFKKSLQAV